MTHGAAVNAHDENGQTPLHKVASKREGMASSGLLSRMDADPNIPGQQRQYTFKQYSRHGCVCVA